MNLLRRGGVQVSQLRKTGKLIMVTFVVRQSSVMHLWHHCCDLEIPAQNPILRLKHQNALYQLRTGTMNNSRIFFYAASLGLGARPVVVAVEGPSEFHER